MQFTHSFSLLHVHSHAACLIVLSNRIQLVFHTPSFDLSVFVFFLGSLTINCLDPRILHCNAVSHISCASGVPNNCSIRTCTCLPDPATIARLSSTFLDSYGPTPMSFSPIKANSCVSMKYGNIASHPYQTKVVICISANANTMTFPLFVFRNMLLFLRISSLSSVPLRQSPQLESSLSPSSKTSAAPIWA